MEHKKYHDRCRWPRSGLGSVLLAEVWAWNRHNYTRHHLPSTVTLTKYRSIQGFQSELVPGTFTRLRSCIVPAEITDVSKCFFSETTWTIETKLPRNYHWKVLYKVCAFYADRKSKMAATAGHRLTLGKCSNMNIMRYGVNVNETTTSKSNCIRNVFFSETINQTHSKLHRNVHWIVLYKV